MAARQALVNRTRDELLSPGAESFDTFVSRLIGLMGRADIGNGAIIEPCNSIHTCFMRVPIDVAFLDDDDRVLAVFPAFPTWRFTPVVRGARRVVELAAGRLGRTVTGDQIDRRPCA